MKLLLKNAKIIDPEWSYNNDRMDIAILNGKIEKIATSIPDNGHRIITSENLHLSIGFFDIGTQIGEPGLEHREDLESISRAAAKGGYTGIASFPNTRPAIHSKSEVKFIIKNTAHSIVDFYPIGAISKDCKGEDITEFIDMSRNGAIAFSDGSHSIEDAGLMLRALQYAKASGGIVINHPESKSVSRSGQIHESEVSVKLGLEGVPDISEFLGLQRDLTLNEYAEGSYCAYNVSTKLAVNLLKEKSNCESTVAYLNLIFEDKDLLGFDVNLKVQPPLRSAKDRKALLKAVSKNRIQAITSGHYPLEEELKKKSFAFAEFGAIGIETVFAALNTYCRKDLNLDTIIEKLTSGPRQILGLETPKIQEGQVANICLFDPDLEWTYSNISSKSKNSPFLHKDLKGKILGVINNKKFSG